MDAQKTQETPQEKLVSAILAAGLMAIADAKGSVEIAAGVYLQTSENLVAEQSEWSPEDQSAAKDFTVAPYWITTDSGSSPEPVDESEMPSLVAENADGVENIVRSFMKAETGAETLPQPKKIEPTIKYYHECPWAVVKTRDGEHSLEVSLTNLHYSEDGKPYLLAYQRTEESGPQQLHLYLI